MSILSNFEDHVAALFEGAAGWLFRSPVEPVQIARAAEREMVKNKLVGPGRTYAPTLFTVLLSPEDDDNLCGFYPTLSAEFATYLTGKAKELGLHLAATPLVRFHVDDELTTGRFVVFAENVSQDELGEIRIEEEATWRAIAPAPDARPMVPAPAPAPERQRPAAPTVPLSQGRHVRCALEELGTGRCWDLSGERVVVGREDTADIVVSDINVSRAHAQFVSEGGGWAIEDLESTNGTFVNGERVTYLRLLDGDVVTFGVTRFEYRES